MLGPVAILAQAISRRLASALSRFSIRFSMSQLSYSRFALAFAPGGSLSIGLLEQHRDHERAIQMAFVFDVNWRLFMFRMSWDCMQSTVSADTFARLYVFQADSYEAIWELPTECAVALVWLGEVTPACISLSIEPLEGDFLRYSSFIAKPAEFFDCCDPEYDFLFETEVGMSLVYVCLTGLVRPE